MSEQTELVVRIDGERIDPPRPPGRPKNPPKPEPESFHDKMRKFIASQDIELSDGQFEQVWSRYQEFCGLYGSEKMPTYWIWRCTGCFCDEQWHLVHNGRHQPQCDGINDGLKTLWAREIVEAVAKQKNLTVKF
jgi:hypothetical protein